MSEFIPIYQYCEEKGVPKQSVYRWIRERKFQENEVKIEVVKVKRIRIKKDAQPNIKVQLIKNT